MKYTEYIEIAEIRKDESIDRFEIVYSDYITETVRYTVANFRTENDAESFLMASSDYEKMWRENNMEYIILGIIYLLVTAKIDGIIEAVTE